MIDFYPWSFVPVSKIIFFAKNEFHRHGSRPLGSGNERKGIPRRPTTWRNKRGKFLKYLKSVLQECKCEWWVLYNAHNSALFYASTGQVLSSDQKSTIKKFHFLLVYTILFGKIVGLLANHFCLLEVPTSLAFVQGKQSLRNVIFL